MAALQWLQAMRDLTDLSTLRVGRYDVLEILGRGGMGVVYDAIDSTLGRHVALKVLPAAVASDANRLARFVREARAASALNHPNVVTIYDIGRVQVGEQDVNFIAMEKVDGGDLRGLLSRKRLTTDHAIDLAVQIADAVASAHAEGIVHRDLKPENIVLSKSGIPKVLDFGLAKLRPDVDSWSVDHETELRSTQDGVILGTVGYMSPEQAQGRPADHRADIFSLGCILYEAVAGRRAFAAGSPVETLNAIIRGEPLPLRDSAPAVPELQRIVGKALAKNPEERYQSAKDMVVDLRALVRERTETSAPLRPVRSRRGPFTALAATVVLMAVALGVWLWQGRSRAEVSHPSPQLKVRRLTALGTVTHATISPDGRFVAYALMDRTIRLRQLATGEELQVVSSIGRSLWGVAFTPDGNSLLYVVKSDDTGTGSCFRVATIGGRPEHLFDGIDSSPAVSPDGLQIAYTRSEFPLPAQSALMISSVDGKRQRVIATRKLPDRFAPLFFAAPSWSPDGASIATAEMRTADPVSSKLILVDAKDGTERVLLGQGWPLITDVEWLPDGSGLVTSASSDGHDIADLQLWFVPYPSGRPTPITTEIASYRGVSVATQNDLLLSINLDTSAQIWAQPLGDEAQAPTISSGRNDGFRGVTLTPNGQMVFTNLEDEGYTLVISNRDGTARTRLTRDAFTNEYPAAFRDGIAYVSSTADGNDVCVTTLAGEGRRVVVTDVDRAPIAVSPDGKWILFQRNRRLWKTPSAGGTATQVLDRVSWAPAWSPQGDRIALLLGDSGTYASEIAVISPDGRQSWSTPFTGAHIGSQVHWMPDASGVIANGGPRGSNDDRNLWAYPFSGAPRPLTQFTDRRAFSWALSPDGRTAFLSRANLTRDAVLVTGFRPAAR